MSYSTHMPDMPDKQQPRGPVVCHTRHKAVESLNITGQMLSPAGVLSCVLFPCTDHSNNSFD